MLKKIFILALAVILAFLGYVAMQPADGLIMRQAQIAAPASAIFPHVNDFHKWEAWSPWAKIDPKAVTTFEGPASGVGAAFGWAGNSEVGKGKMTIIESKPDELIRIKLDFDEPMTSTSVASFTFKPEGEKTLVTWEMRGESTFVQRIFCTLFNANKMVGDMFDKGLASLAVAAGAQT